MSVLKQIVWNKNHNFFAINCKKSLHVYTKNMSKVCTIMEKFNIKSIYWSGNLFYYTTINHLKYGLLNGESTIIKCLDQTNYVIKVDQSVVTLLNKQGIISEHQIKDFE